MIFSIIIGRCNSRRLDPRIFFGSRGVFPSLSYFVFRRLLVTSLFLWVNAELLFFFSHQEIPCVACNLKGTCLSLSTPIFFSWKVGVHGKLAITIVEMYWSLYPRCHVFFLFPHHCQRFPKCWVVLRNVFSFSVACLCLPECTCRLVLMTVISILLSCALHWALYLLSPARMRYVIHCVDIAGSDVPASVASVADALRK